MSDNFNRPIVVIGSPRSGTSLVAGCLSLSGIWTGDCRAADEHNPKGYFENIRLSELRAAGELHPDEVAGVLADQGWDGSPWLHKHTAHNLRVWNRFNPLWVTVWRDVDDVLASRMRGGFYEETRQKAERAVGEHIRNMRSVPSIRVYADELVLRQDFSSIAMILGEYGMRPNVDAIHDFIDANLWHGQ